MCPQTFFHPLSLGFCVTDHSHRNLNRVHRTMKLLTYVLSFLQSLNQTTKFIVPGNAPVTCLILLGRNVKICQHSTSAST